MSERPDFDEDAIPGLDVQGRPDPAYAAALGLVAASPLRRSLAFALDAAIWVLLAVPGIVGFAILTPLVTAEGGSAAAMVADPSFPLALVLILASQALLAVFGLVQLILHGKRGVTVGKASAGLRSVNVARFTAPGFWRVVLRVLVLWGGQVVLPFIGPAVLFSSGLWDAEHRGRSWLDRVGRTWVVRARGALDPLDPRAMRQARRILDAPTLVSAAPLPSLATGTGAAAFTPGPRFNGGVVTAGGAAAAGDDWMPPTLSPAAEPVRPVAAPAPAAASAPALGAPSVADESLPTPDHALSALAATLLFDDGSSIRVSGDGLLGRNPEARSGEVVRHLVPVDDPSMRISKTHASFGIDRSGVWVADRGSTNGTSVIVGGSAPRELVAGERARLPWGSTVVIGGRRFSVAPAKGDA
ncbi:MAG: RDD family protein [Leifsonia sp.]